MMKCPACSLEMPETSRFCGACGVVLRHDTSVNLTATVAMESSVTATRGSESFDEGRFLPGMIVAQRYRVFGLIGRGGMGEVYRAHDLKLGQQVALKFLSEARVTNDEVLAQFYNEVRIARQVSHPQVCRVFDIGEAGGQPYISMEYVDGEDLGALLRRIGRLPHDKAVEIARKLCAGLAAAHDKGVLHRDLKPTNIMLDSRGQVLIMDFGLAGIASQFHGVEVKRGTPAYMAPEQLAGREVSVRSDIYSLGLVLYEMFTGRRAFEASTLAELVRLREESTPPNPRALVQELDPAVERVILRCLDSDPESRPASALAVAAALPGGDPLTAALAAGEIPSPEIIASARAGEGLRPVYALAFLAFIIAGLITYPFINDKASWIGITPLENSPETLAQKAREIAERLGYVAKQMDRAYGLRFDQDYVHYLQGGNRSEGQAPAIRFWYRTSPQYLVADRFGSRGVVTPDDPAPQISGMIHVQLDTRGRLLYFEAIPPQLEKSGGPTIAGDWNPLFAAAELDQARFRPTDPKWLSLASADARAAWTGSLADGPANPLRIEAASRRGKIIYFQVIGPWTRPERLTPFQSSWAEAATNVGILILASGTLIGACVLARLNTRLGRGDRRGAARLSALMFLLTLGAWSLNAHHTPTAGELTLIALGLSQSLLVAALVWISYIALEPYVRRRWPETMITWSRMLAGRFQDVRVGSRILAGVASGVAIAWIAHLTFLVQIRSGGQMPVFMSLSTVLGVPHVASYLLENLLTAISLGLGVFLLFLLLRVVFRKDWLAGAAFVVLLTALETPVYTLWTIPLRLLLRTVIVIVMLRFGMAALVTLVAIVGPLSNFPITANLSAWYASTGLFALALLAGLGVYAFHTALGGRPLFKSQIWE